LSERKGGINRVMDAASYVVNSGLLEDTDCLHLASISRSWPAGVESRRLNYNSEKKVTFYSLCNYLT